MDLLQVVPTEYRADSVVQLFDRADNVTAAIITEVQLRRDDDKLLSWPLYVAALRAKLRRPIALGQPGFVLRPSVISLPEMPQLMNAAEA